MCVTPWTALLTVKDKPDGYSTYSSSTERAFRGPREIFSDKTIHCGNLLLAFWWIVVINEPSRCSANARFAFGPMSSLRTIPRTFNLGATSTCNAKTAPPDRKPIQLVVISCECISYGRKSYTRRPQFVVGDLGLFGRDGIVDLGA